MTMPGQKLAGMGEVPPHPPRKTTDVHPSFSLRSTPRKLLRSLDYHPVAPKAWLLAPTPQRELTLQLAQGMEAGPFTILATIVDSMLILLAITLVQWQACLCRPNRRLLSSGIERPGRAPEMYIVFRRIIP